MKFAITRLHSWFVFFISNLRRPSTELQNLKTPKSNFYCKSNRENRHSRIYFNFSFFQLMIFFKNCIFLIVLARYSVLTLPLLLFIIKRKHLNFFYNFDELIYIHIISRSVPGSLKKFFKREHGYFSFTLWILYYEALCALRYILCELRVSFKKLLPDYDD